MPVMTNNNLSAKGLCGVKRFLTSLFLGANIFTILLLWACCFSTFISTSEHPRLSLLGLVFPFFLLANLAFVLFWIIFKFRLTWIPLLGILIIWGYVPRQRKIQIKKLRQELLDVYTDAYNLKTVEERLETENGISKKSLRDYKSSDYREDCIAL